MKYFCASIGQIWILVLLSCWHFPRTYVGYFAAKFQFNTRQVVALEFVLLQDWLRCFTASLQWLLWGEKTIHGTLPRTIPKGLLKRIGRGTWSVAPVSSILCSVPFEFHCSAVVPFHSTDVGPWDAIDDGLPIADHRDCSRLGRNVEREIPIADHYVFFLFFCSHTGIEHVVLNNFLLAIKIVLMLIDSKNIHRRGVVGTSAVSGISRSRVDDSGQAASTEAWFFRCVGGADGRNVKVLKVVHLRDSQDQAGRKLRTQILLYHLVSSFRFVLRRWEKKQVKGLEFGFESPSHCAGLEFAVSEAAYRCGTRVSNGTCQTQNCLHL